jgi:uncharacterized protein (DUF58 family)
MYFTWILIILVILDASLFLMLPVKGYLAYAFLSLISFYLLDWLVTIKRKKLTIERLYPVPAYQRQRVRVQIVIHNPSRFGQRFLWKDEPPFEADVSGNQGWEFIPARGSATVNYELAISKRGVFHFGDLNIKMNGWLFLFSRQYKVRLPREIKVYPALNHISHYFSGQRANQAEEGAHRTKLFSVGGELAELREFVSGDDYRKINWKVAAHLGKPFINEYIPEKDQNIFLFFDNGRLLFDQISESGSRFDYILDSAILLAYNIIKHGDLVGALSFNCRVERYLPAGKGIKQLQMFIDHFYNLEAVMMESDYRTAFQFWQIQNNKRCLLFIYTDIVAMESSKELINHLKVISRHHRVVLITLQKPLLTKLKNIPITSEIEAYQKGIALELLAQRESQKRTLTSHGIHVLEVEPGNIAVAVTEHYLFLKKTGRF